LNADAAVAAMPAPLMIATLVKAFARSFWHITFPSSICVAHAVLQDIPLEGACNHRLV